MNINKSLLQMGFPIALLAAAGSLAQAAAEREEDSVYSWGRWSVLSPAAGPQDQVAFAPDAANDLGRCESDATCPEPNIPESEPLTLLCAAGQPCGFARVGGFDGEPAGEVEVFELILDEVDGQLVFRVAPGTEGEIASGELPANIRMTTLSTADRTSVRGALLRDDGSPVLVQGFWSQDGSGERGEFIWGLAASAAQMDGFVQGLGTDRIANYQGFTANAGTVNMRVDFNSGQWSGDFGGGRFDFSAAGEVLGSGFAATGFADPQVSGEVQGGFVNAGRNAIGGFQVQHTDLGRDADVFNAALQ